MLILLNSDRKFEQCDWFDSNCNIIFLDLFTLFKKPAFRIQQPSKTELPSWCLGCPVK